MTNLNTDTSHKYLLNRLQIILVSLAIVACPFPSDSKQTARFKKRCMSIAGIVVEYLVKPLLLLMEEQNAS
jgi:hypothetical protein